MKSTLKTTINYYEFYSLKNALLGFRVLHNWIYRHIITVSILG